MIPLKTCFSYHNSIKILRSFLIFFLLIALHEVRAQKIVFNPPKTDTLPTKDSVGFHVEGLPALITLSADKPITPYYRYLWIFGDGSFINATREDSVSHRYTTFSANPGPYEARAYSTDSYSGGNPPPVLKFSNALGNDFTFPEPLKTKEVVEGDRHIKLQRNHEVRPGDTLVNIFSFNNRTNDTLSGQLYLFYNSEVTREVTTDDKGKKSSVKTPQFGSFQLNESLIYYNNVNRLGILDNPPAAVGQAYKKVLVLDYFRKAPGTDQHLFVEFANDSTMFNLIPGDEKGKVSFLAMMTAYTELDTFLDDNQRLLVEGLEMPKFFSGLSEIQPDPDGSDDGLGNLQPATVITDIFQMNADIVKAHDPNQVIAEACGCPDGNGVNKVIVTIECENDGFDFATSVFMEMEIPEELDFNSIFDTLINFHPEIAPGTAGKISLDKDEAARTIRWNMENFLIHGTPIKGAGDPSTQAKVVFSVLTNAGVDLADVPPLQACIRFNDPNGEEVCTLPANIQVIPSSVGSTEMLQCTDCVCPPAAWPWWLWLLIAIGVIIILFILRLYRGSSNPS